MRLFPIAVGLLLSAEAVSQNAYLTNCYVPRYWKANTAWEISARVRNLTSGAPLVTFRLDWRFNGGPVQQGGWQSTTGINPGQYWPYVHPIPFNVPAGSGTLKIWVVGVGETDPSNDTLFFPVNVLEAWATKSVLLEQYTGTWCQFCPAPNATTNTMDADPLIVVAKHHNGDELSNANSTAYWAQFNAEYSPAGVMEQEEFGTLPDDAQYDQWPARADQRKLGVSPASIAIVPAFNAWQRQLTVDVDVTFAAAQTGEFVVNAYLLEDNVAGAQTGALPGYIHQQVVRDVLGGPAGTTGVIPASSAAGATYAHQYTYAVPVEWNASNLRVAVTVTEKRNGASWTVNVADAGLVLVGMEEEQLPLPLSVHPNPSAGDLQLTAAGWSGPVRIQVLSMDGRVVADRTEQAGAQGLRVPGFEQLPAGNYLLRVECAGRAGQQRVVRMP